MVNEKFVLSEMPLNRMRGEPAAGKRKRRDEARQGETGRRQN